MGCGCKKPLRNSMNNPVIGPRGSRPVRSVQSSNSVQNTGPLPQSSVPAMDEARRTREKARRDAIRRTLGR